MRDAVPQVGSSVMIGVHGDATAALYGVLHLKGKGDGMSLVGRELCLTAAQYMILWREIVHVRGSANWLADALSRPEDHDRCKAVRDRLVQMGARELVLVPRNAEVHWRSRSAPGAGALPLF